MEEINEVRPELFEIELIFQDFYFDKESFNLFNTFFYIPKNYIQCPKCNSKNINQYANVFLCFDCKYKDMPYDNNVNFELDTENDCLLRIYKSTGKRDFFHRWLMLNEIKEFCNKNNYHTTNVEVHHKNHLKNHNYKYNLKVMSESEHRSHHENENENKAYRTWCQKVYGEHDYENHWIEFMNWKRDKGEVLYGNNY